MSNIFDIKARIKAYPLINPAIPDVSSLQQEAGSVTADIASNEKQKGNLEDAIPIIEENIAQAIEEGDTEKVAELESDLADAEESLSEVDSTLESLAEQVDSLNNAIATVTESAKEAAKEAANAAKEDLKKYAGGKWLATDLDVNLFPTDGIKVLQSGMDKIASITAVLKPIMKVLQLFLSSFNIISAIISALVASVEKAIDGWIEDIGGAGIFMNVLVPPGFSKIEIQKNNLARLASGGFEGFLKRLEVSLYNTADPNRPIYGPDAPVGGLIIMADAESLDAFFAALKQFAGLFDFMSFLPIITDPPPPSSVNGVSGQYVDKDGKTKPGIKIKWKSPPNLAGTSFSYRVSRSFVRGGESEEREFKNPTQLFGPDGFLRNLQKKIQTKEWPKKTFRVYVDPDFKGPYIANANLVNGDGEFIDFNITDSAGDALRQEYYYVVESGYDSINLWGPQSSEVWVNVDLETCIPSGQVGVIEHRRGFLEYLSPGTGSLGSWSSIQVQGLLPFIPTIAKFMKRLVNTLKGMVKTGSSAFGDFIENLQETIETYLNILDTVVSILDALASMKLGPNVGLLFVPPEEGGVSGFMNTVRSAERPEGGFSGPSGITGGIVLMLGATLSSPLGETKQEILDAKNDAIARALSVFMKLVGGG